MPKGASAKYTIVIPIDEQFPQLSAAAHQWLTHGPYRDIMNAHITGPHQEGHRRVDHLVWIGKETPEMDSKAKQLAVHIAEASNVEALSVIKEGKSGIVHWLMRNNKFSVSARLRRDIAPDA